MKLPAELPFELPLLRSVTFQPEGLHAERVCPSQSADPPHPGMRPEKWLPALPGARGPRWSGARSQVEPFRPDGPSMGRHRSALLEANDQAKAEKQASISASDTFSAACFSPCKLEIRYITHAETFGLKSI